MIRKVRYGSNRVFQRFLVVAGNQNRIYGFDVSNYSDRSVRRMENIMRENRQVMGSISREEAYDDLTYAFPGLKDCYRNLNINENAYSSELVNQ
jgi:hypothetical protein